MPHLTRRLAAPALVLMACATAACDSILGTPINGTLQQQLDQGRAAWQQHGPASYSMVVLRAVGPQEPAAVRLVIESGQIVSGTMVATDEALSPGELAAYRTVDGLFAKVQDAIAQRAPGIYTAYHPQYGFPAELAIDYDRTRLDGRVQVVISEFTPLE